MKLARPKRNGKRLESIITFNFDDLIENALLQHIERICSEQEKDLREIYNELTHYHFAIVLLLFEQDVEVHDNMSIVRRKAFEIVEQSNIINQQYEATDMWKEENI